MKIRLLAILFVLMFSATAQAGEDRWIYSALQDEFNPKIETLEAEVKDLSQKNAQLRKDMVTLYNRIKKLEKFHR